MKKREIVFPEWIAKSADKVHDEMLDHAPKDINTAEGDFFYDATRPVAEEIAKIVNMHLRPALERQFIQTAEGQDLDMRAEEKSIQRHPALKALVTVHVTGKAQTEIPVGTIFTTEAKGGKAAIRFESLEHATIGADGTVNIRCRAIDAGVGGMVAVGTITMTEKHIRGIESVTNLEQSVGGTPPETDEQLRDRLIQNNLPTYSGCDSDYIRWAKEVAGVGDVYVVPESDGHDSGTAKVLILDVNGDPANENIIRAVKEYICPEADYNRPGKAPVDARIYIEAPTLHKVNVSVSLTVDDDANMGAVRRLVTTKIKEYLVGIKINPKRAEKVLVSRVGAAIMSVEGVRDYQNLKLNGKPTDDEVPPLHAVGIGTVEIS